MIIRDTISDSPRKTIRSFIAREGRLSPAHKLALQTHWPRFGLSLQNGSLDFTEVFGRSASVTFEIGFGDGKNLLSLAELYPEQNFIGVEVYKTGIAKLLYGMQERKITNIRIFCADAIEVLEHCIADNSLQQVILQFPDPWPKLRHHKRRIVRDEFANLVHRKLQLHGTLHMATDWENYAQQMMQVMQNANGWENIAGVNNFIPRPSTRPVTKFEQRGHRLGNNVWDLAFVKC